MRHFSQLKWVANLVLKFATRCATQDPCGYNNFMTLNWALTAADCRVAELVTPLILRQFEPKLVNWSVKWAVRTDHTYDMAMNLRPTRNLDHFMADLPEILPRSGFWLRTHHRLSVPHGRSQIRQVVEQYLRSTERGNTCLCSGQCRYPTDPDRS